MGRAATRLRMHWFGLAIALLPALLLPAAPARAQAAAPAATAGPAWAGPARCRFALPDGWTWKDVRWTGACQARLAHGLGTLRALQGGQVQRTFYGRLEAGQPVLGAIELPGGFQAGRFEAGKPVADGERNTLVMAFDEAAAAARQVADGYQKAGNAASARFYQAKADKLAQQID